MIRERLVSISKRSVLAVLAIIVGISAVGAITITPQDRLRSDISATLSRIDSFGKRFGGDGFLKPFCQYVSKGLELSLISLCNGVQVTFNPATRWLDSAEIQSATCDSSRYVCNPSCEAMQYFCGRYKSREIAGETRLRALNRSLDAQRRRIQNKELGFEKKLTALNQRKDLLNSKIASTSQLCSARQTGYLTYCKAAASLTTALGKLNAQVALYEELKGIALAGLGTIDDKIYSINGAGVQWPHGFAADTVSYIHAAAGSVCGISEQVCAAQPTPSPTPVPTQAPTCLFGSDPEISVDPNPAAPNTFILTLTNNDSITSCPRVFTTFQISVQSPTGFSAKIIGNVLSAQAISAPAGESRDAALIITPPADAAPQSRVFTIIASDPDNAAPQHSSVSRSFDLVVGNTVSPSPSPSPSPSATPAVPANCYIGNQPTFSVSTTPLSPGLFRMSVTNTDPFMCVNYPTTFAVTVFGSDGFTGAISGSNVIPNTQTFSISPQGTKTVDIVITPPAGGAPLAERAFFIVVADGDSNYPVHAAESAWVNLSVGDAPTPSPSQSPTQTPTASPTSTPNPYGCDGSPALNGPTMTTPQISIDASRTMATVTWGTVQASDAIINYGTQPSYGNQVQDTAFVAGPHSLSFPLSAGINYFSVRSCTSSGPTYGCTAICGLTIDASNATPQPTATASPAASASPTPSPTLVPSQTPTPTATGTPLPTATATPPPVVTATSTPTPAPTLTGGGGGGISTDPIAQPIDPPKSARPPAP